MNREDSSLDWEIVLEEKRKFLKEQLAKLDDEVLEGKISEGEHDEREKSVKQALESLDKDMINGEEGHMNLTTKRQ